MPRVQELDDLFAMSADRFGDEPIGMSQRVRSEKERGNVGIGKAIEEALDLRVAKDFDIDRRITDANIYAGLSDRLAVI
ncbi:hypothetical protein [Cryobacterium flavum]|uniref:hypothetical protein n=1 Tax=Cryobacterium flavum TaxID=1424659 RepID=UPI001068F195|nr:hypothetical protein [Cryobacterium flavum]